MSEGATTTFTVTPNSGYKATVTGCDGTLLSCGNSYTYTTGSITAACTVTATFSLGGASEIEVYQGPFMVTNYSVYCPETTSLTGTAQVIIIPPEKEGREGNGYAQYELIGGREKGCGRCGCIDYPWPEWSPLEPTADDHNKFSTPIGWNSGRTSVVIVRAKDCEFVTMISNDFRDIVSHSLELPIFLPRVKQ